MYRSIKIIIPLGLAIFCVVLWVYAGTIVGTASLTVATPTATPTGGLGLILAQAVDAVRADVLPSGMPLCASGNTEPCSVQGSVSTSNLAGNDSTDDTAALQADVNAGDVSLPVHTYLIHGTVTLSTRHTLYCQPGAILHSDVNGNILSLSSVSMVTVIGCAFHNGKINVSGGSDNTFVGNTFDLASPFTLTGSTSDNVVAFNDFQGGAPSTSGDATVMYWANRVSGAAVLQMPILTASGGTWAGSNHMAALLNVISYGVTAPSSGNNNGNYQVVQPGASFGGATCAGNDTGDDTNCITNALAGGNIYLASGTYAIALPIDVPANTSMLCNPAAKFHYTKVGSGTGGGYRGIFVYNASNSNSGGNSMFACEIYGIHDPTVQANPANQYNEGLQIAGYQGVHQNDFFAGDNIHNMMGDNILTVIETSGLSTSPRDLAFLFNFNSYPLEPGLHENGGVHIESAFNVFQDSDTYPESDQNCPSAPCPPQQTMLLSHHNRAHANAPDIHSSPPNSYVSCDGDTGIPQNNSLSWCWNNVADGTANGFPAWIEKEPASCSGAVSGYVVGNYAQNLTINGGAFHNC